MFFLECSEQIQQENYPLCIASIKQSSAPVWKRILIATWKYILKFVTPEDLPYILQLLCEINKPDIFATFAKKKPDLLEVAIPIVSPNFYIDFFNNLNDPVSFLDLNGQFTNLMVLGDQETKVQMIHVLVAVAQNITWEISEDEILGFRTLISSFDSLTNLETTDQNLLIQIKASFKFLKVKPDFKLNENMPCLLAGINFFRVEEFRDEIKTLFEAAVNNINLKIPFLDIYSQNISKVSKYDSDFAVSLLKKFLDPYPEHAYTPVLILRLLFNAGENLWFKYNMRSLINDALIRFGNIQAHAKLIYPLRKFVGFEVPLSELDFFSNIDKTLQLNSNIPLEIIKEVLDCHALPSEQLSNVFYYISHQNYSDEILPNLLSLFFAFSEKIGFSIKFISKSINEKIPELEEEKLWINKGEIGSIFGKIIQTMKNSVFGSHLNSIISALSAFEVPNPYANAIFFVLSQVSHHFPASFHLLANIAPKVSQGLLASNIPLILKHKIDDQFYPFIYQISKDISLPNFKLKVSFFDRKNALELKSEIDDQEISVPSFISFYETHPKIFEYSRKHLPIGEWLYTSKDFPLLQSLDWEGFDEGIKERFVEHSKDEPTFVLEDPTIEEVPEFFHRNTLPDLVSFLWHNTNSLPENYPLEELAFKFPKNRKLIIGFFYYALRKSWKINGEKFSSLVNEPISAIAFFKTQRFSFKSPPKWFIPLLQRLKLTSSTPEFFIWYFRSQSGLNFELAKSIIGVDVKFFSTFVSRLSLEYSNNFVEDLIDEISQTDAVGLDEIGRIMIRHYFIPSHINSLPPFDLPSNYHFPPYFQILTNHAFLDKPVKFPTKLIDVLLVKLGQFLSFPFTILSIFLSSDLSKSQFEKLSKLIAPKQATSASVIKFVIPAFSIQSSQENTLLPQPSFGRSMYRSLLSGFAPPIPQSVIFKICSSIASVHPALAYEGFTKYQMNTWPTDSLLTKLQCGKIDNETVSYSYRIIQEPNETAIMCYNTLIRIQPNELNAASPWATGRFFTYLDLAQTLIETATLEKASILFAIRACDSVFASVSPDLLSSVIFSQSFLSRPNFINACLIFRKFYSFLKSKEMDQFFSLGDYILETKTKMFKDPKKAEIFPNANFYNFNN